MMAEGTAKQKLLLAVNDDAPYLKEIIEQASEEACNGAERLIVAAHRRFTDEKGWGVCQYVKMLDQEMDKNVSPEGIRLLQALLLKDDEHYRQSKIAVLLNKNGHFLHVENFMQAARRVVERHLSSRNGNGQNL